jgi:hypothetical protein
MGEATLFSLEGDEAGTFGLDRNADGDLADPFRSTIEKPSDQRAFSPRSCIRLPVATAFPADDLIGTRQSGFLKKRISPLLTELAGKS